MHNTVRSSCTKHHCQCGFSLGDGCTSVTFEINTFSTCAHKKRSINHKFNSSWVDQWASAAALHCLLHFAYRPWKLFRFGSGGTSSLSSCLFLAVLLILDKSLPPKEQESHQHLSGSAHNHSLGQKNASFRVQREKDFLCHKLLFSALQEFTVATTNLNLFDMWIMNLCFVYGF